MNNASDWSPPGDQSGQRPVSRPQDPTPPAGSATPDSPTPDSPATGGSGSAREPAAADARAEDTPAGGARPQDPAPAFVPPAPPPPEAPPRYPASQYPGSPYPAPQYGMRPPAAKPGVIPLRPLGFGEILDGAVTTVRTYPKQTLGVSAVVVVITQLLVLGLSILVGQRVGAFVSYYDSGMTELDILSTQLGALFAMMLPGLVLTLLSTGFLSGYLTIVVGKAVLGQRVAVGEAWRHVRPRLAALIGLSLLYSLIIMAGAVVLVIPGIWLYVLFSLATTALVLEGVSVGRALGRSQQLINGAWWRTFGLLLVSTLITIAIALVVQIPFTMFDSSVADLDVIGAPVTTVTTLVLETAGAIVAETVTMPFAAAVIVLVYVDRRMRREGMDIELARQAGVTPPGPGQPGA